MIDTKIIAMISVVVFLISAQACTTKGAYISLQKHQELMCNKVPESDYEACMKNANESYEDYNQKREEIIKK